MSTPTTPATQVPIVRAEEQRGVARLTVSPPAMAVYVVAGLALTATAIALALRHDTGLSSVLLFAVLPDAALLLAVGEQFRRGQLPRRAVPAYNLLHHPAVPALLGVVAVTGLLDSYWLVASLAWAAHICFDRGAGYGLRNADGWQRA